MISLSSGALSNRILLVWYLRRRREFFVLRAPRLACLFDSEIGACLDRLGGLGGVW